MKKIKNFFVKILNIITSDVYRSWIFLEEFLSKNDKIDVAYITNFQNDVERGFMGSFPLLRNKLFTYSLKLRMKGGYVGRIITINSLASDLVKDFNTRKFNNKGHIARAQVREAIEMLYKKGVKVVLFGASTKRLFSDEELAEINSQYTEITFTIGDNGTTLELLRDVEFAIKSENISKNDKIIIIGPNGFLGNSVKNKLISQGYSSLSLVSQSDKNPFSNINDAKLVVACSHHPRVRLTSNIIKNITHNKGIFVVDVCRPYNFTRKEFYKCLNDGILVKRMDAGNSYNKNLKYEGSIIANIALRQVGLSQNRLFGCFSEASALANFSYKDLVNYDFLSVNNKTIDFVNKAFNKAGFEICYPRNFGELVDINKKINIKAIYGIFNK